AEARATYRRALALIEEALARGGGPAHLPVARAVLAAKTGDCALATAAADALWREGPRTAQRCHDLAQAWALCDRPDEALSALAEAVDAGFSPGLLREEDEFASLAGDPRFRALGGGQ
ncbi:MAG TPA: hypothetical protein VF100_01810, partial [Thermoanaerobaculia bacterium]